MTEKIVKIVLVEDDMYLRKMYELGLKKAGFEIKSAENGKQGLELINTENPDLILLDVIMPELNGFEVLKQLNESGKIKNYKIIILTNLGQEDDIKKAIDLGAKDFIIKSNFTINEVVKKIKKFLK